MKKNTILILCLSIAISAVSSADTSISKMYDVNEYGYRFVDGFGFLASKTSDVSMEDIVDAEIEQVLNDASTEPYAIAGISEGGLNVLAFATKLKENQPDEYEKLTAIITVSGIDRGLKALEGGFEQLLFHVYEDGDILNKGYIGTLTAGAKNSELVLLLASKDMYLKLLGSALPFFNDYIKPIAAGAGYSEFPEIFDIVPNSDFIKTYVAETTATKYRIPEGTGKNIDLDSTGITISDAETYALYTEYQDKIKFPDDKPIGYIVGTKNNTLSVLDSDIVNNALESLSSNSSISSLVGQNKEELIRNICSEGAKDFRVRQGINIAKSVLGVDVVGKSVNAIYCANAASWLENIDDELNEIKNSDENDGLVACISQFYPKTAYDKLTDETVTLPQSVFGGGSKGYLELELNHAEIDHEYNDDVVKVIVEMLKELE